MQTMTPNLLATLALVLWPIVPVLLYRTKSFVRATLWSILAAQLVLPVGTFFKIPMIPQFDKNSIPNLCILIAFLITAARPTRPRRTIGLADVLIGASLASPLITSLLNTDTIVVGTAILPGVGLYDGVSAVITQTIALIPFLLGRRMMRSVDDLGEIIRVLALAGIAYSILLLFEIRFSPQLHFWVYGYYPSDFIQQMREGGGFRPMAFMGHGLIACFFLMTTVIAAAALWRTKQRGLGLQAQVPTVYLGGVLALCKSGAALAYGLLLAPLVVWATPKLQMRVAVALAVLALLYPLMRLSEVFPTRDLVSVAQIFSPSRAGSLQYRFDQEEALLEKVAQRPLFGWGRYGRNRVLTENWQGATVDASITDGRWIITFGQFGIFGFFAEFGLLAIPIFGAAAALRAVARFRDAVTLAAVALIIAANIVDLLPNSALSPWSWLMAGSLLGCSERIRALARKRPRQHLALQPG
jgi:hypothetical protein